MTGFLRRRDIKLAAFCVGFAALLYETYCLHVIFIYIPRASQYAALSVAGFLAGMGVAAWAVTRFVHARPQRAKPAIVGLNILVIGACGLIYRDHAIFAGLIDSWPGSRQGLGQTLYLNTVVFTYAFLPAFCLGGLFPLLNGFFVESRDSAGQDTGQLYFWDLAGSVAGAIVTGFYLIPYLGLNATLLVAVTASLTLAAMMYRIWLAYTIALSGTVLVIAIFPL